MPRRQPTEKQLVITDVTRKGHGIAKFTAPGGHTCRVEVPGSLPGDQVRALLLGKRKGWRQGRLLAVEQPAAERVTPRCQHSGECGGCCWQHMNYTAQLVRKAARVHQLFEGEECAPIISCEQPWEYRNKMEFSFSSDRQGGHFLGLMASQGRGRVVDLQTCHLVIPWFTAALHAVRQWWEESDLQAYRAHTDEGSLRTVTLRASRRTNSVMVLLTVSGRSEFALTEQQQVALVEAVQAVSHNCELSVVLQLQHIAKGIPTRFEERLLAGPGYLLERLELGENRSLLCRISPTAFFQPNPAQAEKLYRCCLQWLGEGQTVWDLCSGTGTLTLAAGLQAKQVIGVEINPMAVADAQENSQLNRLDNVSFIVGDIRTTMPVGEPPDVIIVDPPRAGLPRAAIDKIIEFGPMRVIYVSCNPTTQAEDVRVLKENGYRIIAIQPVDQFPHTVHLENIIILDSAPVMV